MRIEGTESLYAPQNVRSVAADKTEEKITEQSAPESKRDEYVPAEEDEPIGLYEMGVDEDGNPSLKFDDPESKSETCTANTDKVDKELEQLRKKENDLERQLASANEEQSEEIRRQLEQVRLELSQKDNDGYRRSNAIFS